MILVGHAVVNGWSVKIFVCECPHHSQKSEALPLAALPIWVGVEPKHHRNWHVFVFGSKAIGAWVIDVTWLQEGPYSIN